MLHIVIKKKKNGKFIKKIGGRVLPHEYDTLDEVLEEKFTDTRRYLSSMPAPEPVFIEIWPYVQDAPSHRWAFVKKPKRA